MIIELVGDVLRKKFGDGVSDKLSPLAIVEGKGPPDFNKMKLEYGQYVQAFQDNKITNTNETRSIGTIVLFVTPKKRWRV